MTEKFQLGELRVTQAAEDLLTRNRQSYQQFLSRHLRGDWGDVHPAFVSMNEKNIHKLNTQNLPLKELIQSQYQLADKRSHIKIITYLGLEATVIFDPLTELHLGKLIVADERDYILAYEDLVDQWRKCRDRVDSYEKGNGRNNLQMVEDAKNAVFLTSNTIGDLVDAIKSRNLFDMAVEIGEAQYEVYELVKTVSRLK
ncbi:MAG: hypothetical protein U0350_15215 [Caldilineaceae bacterium]